MWRWVVGCEDALVAADVLRLTPHADWRLQRGLLARCGEGVPGAVAGLVWAGWMCEVGGLRAMR